MELTKEQIEFSSRIEEYKKEEEALQKRFKLKSIPILADSTSGEKNFIFSVLLKFLKKRGLVIWNYYQDTSN